MYGQFAREFRILFFVFVAGLLLCGGLIGGGCR